VVNKNQTDRQTALCGATSATGDAGLALAETPRPLVGPAEPRPTRYSKYTLQQTCDPSWSGWTPPRSCLRACRGDLVVWRHEAGPCPRRRRCHNWRCLASPRDGSVAQPVGVAMGGCFRARAADSPSIVDPGLGAVTPQATPRRDGSRRSSSTTTTTASVTTTLADPLQVPVCVRAYMYVYVLV
jgi:hypothetical protein